MSTMYDEPRLDNACGILSFGQMRSAYFTDRHNRKTALAFAFWSDANLQFVKSRLESVLSEEAELDVVVATDDASESD